MPCCTASRYPNHRRAGDKRIWLLRLNNQIRPPVLEAACKERLLQKAFADASTSPNREYGRVSRQPRFESAHYWRRASFPFPAQTSGTELGCRLPCWRRPGRTGCPALEVPAYVRRFLIRHEPVVGGTDHPGHHAPLAATSSAASMVGNQARVGSRFIAGSADARPRRDLEDYGYRSPASSRRQMTTARPTAPPTAPGEGQHRQRRPSRGRRAPDPFTARGWGG